MEKVVIIGGGYAGLYALREVIKQKDIQITLIDKHSYHNLQPEVYDLIANKSTFADITIDLNTLSSGFNHDYFSFKNLKIRRIDRKEKKIYSEEGEIVSFDYLIVAYGSRTYFPEQIEGLSNASDIKKLHRAITFKQQFEKEMYLKVRNENVACEETNIVVVGAGLSGVEIAAEMADKSKKFFKRGKFACTNLKITLVSSPTTILPGLNKELVNICQKRLKSLGINIVTGVKLQSMDDNYVYLSNGTKILQSFTIFAGGIEVAPIKGLEGQKTNNRGQFKVRKTLQGIDDNIFFIGDCAEIMDSSGEQFPSNVTLARSSGVIAGRNVLNLINGTELKECNPELEGILIALGGKYAAGNLYGKINIKGKLAYYIKSFVFWSYRYPLLSLLKSGYKKIQNRLNK